MATVYVNIGSNLGQPRLNITKAMKAIGDRFGIYEISHIIESEPWGFKSKNRFLNLGMKFESEEAPEEILTALQEIQNSISKGGHRGFDGRYIDREIDIDIVAIDDLEISTGRLTLPHAHLAEREFFLKPMEELAPDWRHPSTGLTCSEMLEALAKKES